MELQKIDTKASQIFVKIREFIFSGVTENKTQGDPGVNRKHHYPDVKHFMQLVTVQILYTSGAPSCLLSPLSVPLFLVLNSVSNSFDCLVLDDVKDAGVHQKWTLNSKSGYIWGKHRHLVQLSLLISNSHHCCLGHLDSKRSALCVQGGFRVDPCVRMCLFIHDFLFCA